MKKKIIIAVLVLILLAGSALAINYLRPEKQMARHYAKGLIYLRNGRYAAAILQFKAAMAIDPDQREIRLHLAKSYIGNGEPDKALPHLKHLLAKSPTYIQAHPLLIKIYLGQKKFQQALDVCNDFARLAPKNATPLHLRGMMHWALNQKELAEKQFTQAIAIDRSQPQSYLSLSQLYWQMRRHSEATAILEKYLKKVDPTNFAVRQQLAEQYLKLKKVSQAVHEFTYLRQKQPKSMPLIAPTFSLALLLSGRNDEALPMAEAALRQLGRKNTAAAMQQKVILHYVIGLANYANKDFATAVRYLLWVVKNYPHYLDARYRLAMAYLQDRKPLLAVPELLASIKNTPKHLPSRILLAIAYAEQKKLKQAEEQCLTILKQSPDNIEARRLLAKIYLDQNKTTAARSRYREIARLRPKSAEGQIGLALLDISEKRYDAAVARLKKLSQQQALAKDQQVMVKYLLAQIWFQRRNLEKALAYLDKILQKNSEFAAARILLARIRLFQGLPQLAIEQYQKLLSANPQNSMVRLQLLRLFLRMRQKQRALQLLNAIGNIDKQLLQELQALIHYSNGDYQQAEKILAAIADKKSSTRILAGDVANAQGKYSEAIAAYQLARLADKDAQVDMRLGLCYYYEGKWQEAAEHIQRHLRHHPDVTLLRLFLAMTFVHRRDYEQALDATTDRLGKDKKYQAMLRMLRANIYLAQRNFAAAVEEIKKVPEEQRVLRQPLQQLVEYCQRAGSDFTILMHALLLSEIGKTAAGAVAAEKAVAALSGHSSARFIQAGILQKGQKFAQAEKVLAQLTANGKTPAHVDIQMAKLALQQQRLDQAAKLYRRALTKVPGIVGIELQLGMIYERQGKKNQAVNHYKKVLDATKSQPTAALRIVALNNLGWLLLSGPSANPRLALKCTQAAFRQRAYSWQIADTLGWAYFHVDDYLNAQRYCQYASRLNPSSASIYYRLALIYIKQKQHRAARASLEKALALSKEFPEVAQARKLLENLRHQ